MKLKKQFLSLRRDHYGLKLTEGLGIVENVIRVFEDIDVNEQWGVTKQEIMWLPACYEEILEEKKRPCLVIFQRLISTNHVHGLVHRHLDCWTMEKMIQVTGLRFRGSLSSLKCHLLFISCISVNFSWSMNMYIFLSCSEHTVWTTLSTFALHL